MKNSRNTVSMIAAKINKQDLVIISENTSKLVPIKPICAALGIDFKSQYAKLKDDENLSSTMVLSTTVQEAFNQSKEQLKEAKKQYDAIKAIDFNQWKEEQRQLEIPFKN